MTDLNIARKFDPARPAGTGERPGDGAFDDFRARSQFADVPPEQMDLYQQVILEHNKKPRNFGKLEPADVKRLRHLEQENAKLKKLLAEAMLDNAMLKDIAAKKW